MINFLICKRCTFKIKAVFSFFILAFLVVQTANAQDLTIATSGETGTSGANWSIVGNELTVTASNVSATIHPSVITNHLLNSGDLTVVLPWVSGSARNIIINNTIEYEGNTNRTLTFKAANSVTTALGVSIAATNAALNLILRTAVISNASYPDFGKVLLNNTIINTNGGHFWIGGGNTDATWNGLTVGTVAARTVTENESGVQISNGTISTNGGNITIKGISYVTQTISGTSNQGVLIENSSINSGAGTIAIEGNVNGKYKYGFGILITSASSNTSITSTTGSIWITGMGQDEIGTDSGYRHAVFFNASNTFDISVKSTSGAITLDGNAAFTFATVQDKSGLQIQVNHLDSFVQVVSQLGNISIKGTNPDDSDGQYNNAIRFVSANVANSIRIGYDAVNAYSGNILIEGNSICQRLNQTGSGSISVKTSGALTFQSKDNIFTQLRAGTSDLLKLDDDWDFGTICSNFTFGKSTNTSIVNTINPISVAGPITIYAGLLRIENTITSSNTGDITLIANGSNSGVVPSVYIYADILKTGGQRSKLTIRGGGRVQYAENRKVEATNTILDVVFWSDYDNSNNDGGTTAYSDIITNGGHVWLGGSNSYGGTSIWNGLSVGNGPSIGTTGSTNWNALDLGANISTTGGDVFIWSGDANTGGNGFRGIQLFLANKTINAGTGNITLITNAGVKSYTLTLNTTGKICITPNASTFTNNPFVYNGTMSGNHFVGSDSMNYIIINDFQSVNEFNLGNYSNANGWNFANAGAVTLSADIVTNGSVRINASNIALNANLKTQNAANLFLKGNTTIAAGKSIECSGNFTHDGNLIFKSNATGTSMFGTLGGTYTTVSGTATVERFIPARRAFRFLSSSVTTSTSILANWQENSVTTAGLGTHITGGVSNGFDSTSTNNPSLFSYVNGAWGAVTNTNVNTLTAGVPFRIMVRGDRTIDLTTNTPTPTATTLRATGTLKTGNFSPIVNQAADGFSFVGNPYQAPVDIKAVLTAATNMNSGVVYYWDPTLNTRGGYVTRDLTANTNDIIISSFNQYLQPGQAVFVKKASTATAASMTFLESNKAIANAAAGVFRNTDTPVFGLLRANLRASIDNQWTTIEGALALFNPSFSTSITQEDAAKMSNLDEEVSFVQNSTALAIACQPNPSITDELPIKFNNIRHSNYQWQFELDNYNGATPYLFDAQNNTFTVISNGTIVPFTADATTANRFKIVFQNTALNNPEFATTIVMYPNPAKSGSSFVLQGVSPKSSVVLYTTLGQSIAVSTSEYETGLQVTPKTLISSGVYIVSITTEGKTSQVKWIVE